MEGMGGMESLGELAFMEYFEVLRRRRRGGEVRPVGVVAVEGRENSASSALERTRRRGGMLEVSSLGGEESSGVRVGSGDMISGVRVLRSQIMIVESEPVEMSVVCSGVSSRATSVTELV